MKTFSILTSILFSISVYSQAEPLLSHRINQVTDAFGNWQDSQISSYKYDEDGKLIESRWGYIDSTFSDWQYTQKSYLTYNDQDRLIDELGYNVYNGEWVLRLHKHYTYNANGCLQSLNRKTLYEQSKYQQHIEYRYNEDCQLDSQIVYVTSNHDTPISSLKKEKIIFYRYEQDGLRVIIDELILNGQETGTFYENFKISEFNLAGQLTCNISQGTYKETYTYYEDEDIETIEYLELINGNWEYIYSIEHEKIFDENNFPIKTTYFYNDPSLSNPRILNTYDIENYCDGKTRTMFNPFEKFIHQYNKPAECFDFDDNEIDILAFPNPASDIIQLYSKSFQTGALTVSIYDARGSIVYNRKMEGREEGLRVNVSGYSPGVYFVHLTGLGKKKTVKFLVNP